MYDDKKTAADKRSEKRMCWYGAFAATMAGVLLFGFMYMTAWLSHVYYMRQLDVIENVGGNGYRVESPNEKQARTEGG
jgi:hypothetical protein